MTTSINDLLDIFNDEIDETTEINDMQQPEKRIFDFSLSHLDRMSALKECYDNDPDNIMEIISKINSIYCFSPIGLMRKFISEISKRAVYLPLELRIDCATTLAYVEGSETIGMTCLYGLEPLFCELNLSIRIEHLINLVNFSIDHDNLFTDILTKLYNLTDDKTIDEEYRYKIILSLKNKINIDIMINACLRFINSQNNTTSFKILACQNILSVKDDNHVESILLNIMRDTSIQHRFRADACDVLLHYGSDIAIRNAEDILKELGGQVFSIYDNKENVHTKEIENNVVDMLNVLDKMNIEIKMTFEDVSKQIMTLSGERNKLEIDKIERSLLRIDIDQTMFKHVDHTLKSMLLLLYAYIDTHEHRHELCIRLIEELIDMSGTCTSGFSSRLMNVLSGFVDANTSLISWEEQIVSNLFGRLNARLKHDKNMDIILQQMTNIKLSDRCEFFSFFAQHISQIKEEMYNEFKLYITDEEWDLYFRNAILIYEQ